jgi:hypothetical protein
LGSVPIARARTRRSPALPPLRLAVGERGAPGEALGPGHLLARLSAAGSPGRRR